MQIFAGILTVAVLALGVAGCSGGSSGDPTKDDAANAKFDNSKPVPAEKWSPAPGALPGSEAAGGGSDEASGK